jgi:hypothetical protein
MWLKYTEKIIREVNYHDLDEFISEIFGIEYECVIYEEWGNYQSHSYTVEGRLLDGYTAKELGYGSIPKYSLGQLLDHACHLEYIEPGEYIIDVFW